MRASGSRVAAIIGTRIIVIAIFWIVDTSGNRNAAIIRAGIMIVAIIRRSKGAGSIKAIFVDCADITVIAAYAIISRIMKTLCCNTLTMVIAANITIIAGF